MTAKCEPFFLIFRFLVDQAYFQKLGVFHLILHNLFFFHQYALAKADDPQV